METMAMDVLVRLGGDLCKRAVQFLQRKVEGIVVHLFLDSFKFFEQNLDLTQVPRVVLKI